MEGIATTGGRGPKTLRGEKERLSASRAYLQMDGGEACLTLSDEEPGDALPLTDSEAIALLAETVGELGRTLERLVDAQRAASMRKDMERVQRMMGGEPPRPMTP